MSIKSKSQPRISQISQKIGAETHEAVPWIPHAPRESSCKIRVIRGICGCFWGCLNSYAKSLRRHQESLSNTNGARKSDNTRIAATGKNLCRSAQSHRCREFSAHRFHFPGGEVIGG
jgi:hypothetical protein